MKNALKTAFAMTVLASCNNCEPWGKKSARSLQTVKSLYNKDSIGFQRFGVMLDEYLKDVHSNESWNKDSLNKIQNLKFRKNLEVFFEKNAIQSGYVWDSNRVYFYPVENSDYVEESDNCPAYSYDIIYIRNKPWFSGDIDTSSPNWINYKIADHWYLRTGVASL